MSTDPPTVVSTTPSGTEICYALGVEPAGVSHQCDFPPAARDQPTLTTSDGEGGNYEIDVDLLRDLAPDVIVTQTVCGVCAVDEPLVREELGDRDGGPEIVALEASDLGSVSDCIRQVGAALDRADRAESVVDQFRDCVDQIGAMTATVGHRPSVLVLEWLDPLRTAGNWVPELVEAAGGTSPFSEPGERSTELSWADVRAADPDIIVVAPCSLDEETASDHAVGLRRKPGWAALTAVENDRVFALNGSVLSRWTPRLGGELERLAGICHPTVIDGEPDAVRLA